MIKSILPRTVLTFMVPILKFVVFSSTSRAAVVRTRHIIIWLSLFFTPPLNLVVSRSESFPRCPSFFLIFLCTPPLIPLVSAFDSLSVCSRCSLLKAPFGLWAAATPACPHVTEPSSVSRGTSRRWCLPSLILILWLDMFVATLWRPGLTFRFSGDPWSNSTGMVSDKIRCVTLSKQFSAQVFNPSPRVAQFRFRFYATRALFVKDRDLAVRPFFCQSGRSLTPWSGFLTEQ